MDDIIIAQQIVGNTYRNIKKSIYHDTSFIFTTTNEKISFYEKFFQIAIRFRRRKVPIPESGKVPDGQRTKRLPARSGAGR